ncbi:fumarylacetoacetate hydrolase family protein [Inquilinus limosus]|uniref:Fumarylacetoacetate hydrolase n=1 Tax=Inquilinus limosus TaxID=171674 RepID=A0A211ZHZ1_9PROT|nr:fumarylacetoacetate hydrolase family protein [Inquilinus limosus]OWJ64889.1 fumarylacetoacetate hydrolase [Inquilinus limosus]
MKDYISVAACLPADADRATLVGRVWLPQIQGPAVVALRGGQVIDITRAAPTVADLISAADPAALARADGPVIGSVAELLANADETTRDAAKPWPLAPIDLQAVKAAGVTFVASMLERVIEEQARGDATKADAIRQRIVSIIGDDLAAIKPGSADAQRIKDVLLSQNAWSQYLEVGIGPDAEIFTKSQPMSSVGLGAEIGILPISTWNNPEPEIVLVVASSGKVVGATLGNDVNLRDLEGRSALLLGKAKDNNASSAIGPFIRLFDGGFGIDDIRKADLSMAVHGPEGYTLQGHSSISKISRDPLDLAGQMLGPNHQYPDGAVLFLGTMFAPTDDREAPGMGFTHKIGDIVTISTPSLGMLVNRVNHSDKIAPWTFGARALMASLAKRGLLPS